MTPKAFLLLLPLACSLAFADAPDWIETIPYDEAYFFGVGSGPSESIARERALTDIKMQLSAKVNSIIIIEQDKEEKGIKETIDFAVNSSSLRGAEEEDRYEEDGVYWFLMKYCDECSNILANSILATLVEKEAGAEFVEAYARTTSSKAVKLKRMLDDLDLKDFNTRDISVERFDDSIAVNVYRFLPDSTELTEGQKEGLHILGEALFSRLTSLGYAYVTITGHANPTDKSNEESELDELSRMRAQTMEQYLSLAGLEITEVDWKGGDETVGDWQTEDGKARNRRVEIIIGFRETS